MRLLYHAATVKASGNVNNEGLIRREREERRFGFRRAGIFRRHQADLGLLLAALGEQQRHQPDRFSVAFPRSQQSPVRGSGHRNPVLHYDAAGSCCVKFQ